MRVIGDCKTIFMRELFSYFNSLIFYIFIVVFTVLSCGMYMTHFFLLGNADMRYFFSLLPIILCVFLPAVTMRLWAEDKKGNTYEMLLTFPMHSVSLVLGKFFASFVFYLLALSATLTIPIMLTLTGNPDSGPLWGGYIGAAFLGAFFLSFGLFISVLCKDQIVAFIVAMIGCFLFYLSGMDFMAALIDGWLSGVGTFLKEHFGLLRHYNGFEKGVLDLKDILYFVVMTVIFLTLNVFALEDRMRPKAKILFSFAVAISISISVLFNWIISDVAIGRFDLTEARMYTVSEATKSILRSVQAPVHIKLYISPPQKMPTAFKTLEQDIKDKLLEFQLYSGGNLEFKVIHMELAGSEEADSGASSETLADPAGQLHAKGITPFQVQSIEEDEMGIKVIYAAIAIAYKEKEEEIIPRVIPQNVVNLEYELISKIYRMTLDKKPQIALVAPYEEKMADPQMIAFLKQLGQSLPAEYREDRYSALESVLEYEGYDFARLRLTRDEPIPADTDTLVIIDPEGLAERQKYEIDSFLHQGGNVIIAAQGFRYQYNTDGGSGVEILPHQVTHGLNPLLETYGVRISDEMLMDDQYEMISITSNQSRGPFAVQVPVKIPTHIKITQDSLNPDVSITSRLDTLFYIWGSSLILDEEKIKENQLTLTVLFTSGDTSWTVPFYGGQLLKTEVAKQRQNAQSNLPLAVLLEGTFPLAYAGKDRPPWSDSNESADHQTQQERTARPGKLIVIGCAAMFEESFIQGGGMLTFFSNCIDAVSLGETLINIRSKQPINRTIRPLDKGEKLWYRFMTLFLIPLVVVLTGLVRVFIRRKQKEHYMKSLKNRGAAV
jgi:ABC-2 type transport system permease protein